MPIATRRPHKKSRHGCQQCKKNRTKCDEKRPICGRCGRTGVKCSLMDSSSTLIIIDKSTKGMREDRWNTPPISPPISDVVSVSNPSEISTARFEARAEIPSHPLHLSDIERDRLRLMSYYGRYTAQSINNLTHGTEEGRSIWQIDIPELAFKNDYLLCCLLSISALHIALCDQSERSASGVLAVEHHSQALALLGSNLQHVTAENFDALFAFACLTALYSFGINLKDRHQLAPLVKIHEIFTMIRGTSIIVKNGQQWLRNGIWSVWFCPEPTTDSRGLPPEVEEVLVQLTNRIDVTITTSSQRELYEGAIEALRKNFFAALVSPRSQMSIVYFPVATPPGFSEMICLAEPLALSILANWAAILHWLREHIWLQDWGMQTIKAVHAVLPPDWHSCITWALKELEVSRAPLSLITAQQDKDTRDTFGPVY